MPFSGLLMAHPGPNYPFHGKWAYGPFWGLSWDFLYRSKQSLLGLSSVWGNSRARGLSVIRGNQTRLCRIHEFAGWVCSTFLFVFWEGIKMERKTLILRGGLLT